MEITIERHVEQVEGGVHYKGYIRIGYAKLDYDMKFSIPIPLLLNLDLTEPCKTPKEVRERFQLAVSMGKVSIDLTDEEFDFFLSKLLDFVIDFYNNKQTCGNKDSTNSMQYRLQPKICDLLNVRKFGYPLAD